MTSYKVDDFHTVHVGHVEIQHHEVDGLDCQSFDGFEAAAGLRRLDRSQRTERGDHHASHRWRVVNDQDVVHLQFVRHLSEKTLRLEFTHQQEGGFCN